MAYTETTTESWGSRLGGALKGIVIGFGLIAAGIGGLFWNEGRAVKTTQALEEGQANVQIVDDNSKIDPAMEGKLVHMTGTAVTEDVLNDQQFGISHQGIKLARNVQYYQWVEESHTEEHKNAGGSVTKTTTYTYEQKWVNKPVNSSNFKEAGHNNAVCMSGVANEDWQAENVAFGAFKLNKGQISRVDNTTTYSLAEYKVPASMSGNTTITGDELYISWPAPNAMPVMQQPVMQQPGMQQPAQAAPQPVAFDQQTGKPIYGYDPQTGRPIYGYNPQTGQPILDPQAVQPAQPGVQPAQPGVQPVQPGVQQPAQPTTADPAQPKIGDMRVTWTVVSPKEDVSLVAVQNKGSFSPYVAKSSGYKVDLFSCGTKTSDEMFQDAHDANTMMTWLIRLGGWLALFIGFKMILKPISVAADVLPFLGNLAEVGLGIVAFFLSSVIALVVIAVAWLFYRPILGILLLAMVVGLIVWYIKRKNAKKAAAAPAA